MFNFLQLIFTVCIFQGVITDFANSAADDTVSNVTSFNIIEYDASEFENQAEYDSKTSDYTTTVEDLNEDKEYYDEFAYLEYKDAVPNKNELKKQGEYNTESSEVMATEGCFKESQENTGNNKATLNCSLPNESATCVKSCPPMRTCDNRKKIFHCPKMALNASCTYQCSCNDGYYRNSNGFCVTSELCDKKCTGANEEYKADKKTCPLEICPSKLSVMHFACNPKEVGQPGCACKPGFLRLNANSTCIPKEQCPGQGNKTLTLHCTLPHESLKCVKLCPRPRTCATRHLHYKCPNNVHETCKDECVCDDGFYRNSDGFCVTSDLCDKKCPGPNEVYKADKKTCPPEICKSIVSRYACDPKGVGQPGCICKPGFLRLTLNSTCMPTKECPELANQPPKCTLPNESMKCVKSCPRPKTCATRNIRYKCLSNSNETCNNECVCDDGFYRNSDGFCVTYDLCDKKCTRPNEEYKADKKKCPLEICPSKISVIRYACNPKEVGQPGCACKPGFLRLNANSTCIPKEQCPGQGNTTLNCSLPNENAKCLKSCPPMRTCENRKKIYHCPKMALNASCTYQCACNDGYYRNSDGFCVTSELCDKKCARPNEVYKADKKTCPLEICPSSKFVIRYACNPREVGQPGCVCKPGFLRISPNSTCIQKEQCPSQNKTLQCTLPNESLKCAKSCPRPRTCATRNLHYKCPNNVNETCKDECVCDDGFYRNSDGFCVTSDLCDKKCPRLNEEYKADKKTCPPEICKSIVSRYACHPKEVGQPGCVCKPGFLRLTLNSTCIPTKECPELANQLPECTLPNESLKCVKTCPRPKTCATRNIRYKCLSNANETCNNECVCDDGFYRNSDGFCVTYDLCDKKCTGPNEEYKADKKTCPLETCPSKISVIRYACNPKEVGQPGCSCKPGFLRLNANSTCIPKEQCPGQGNTTLNCSLPNESATCIQSCPPMRTCENRKKIYHCPEMALNASCTYQCACNDGYYRNSDGFCVTSELCDKKCSGPNEIYKSDKKSCPLEICPSSKFVIQYACNPNEEGHPGCVCKPGFLRSGPNSTCIPEDQCPSRDKPTQCGLPNESLKCVKSCPQPWTCDTRDLRYKCFDNKNETCKYECVCDDDFYRNSDGFCVTYDLCDKKCTGPNEMYKADKKTCPPETCESILALYKCDSKEKGQPGCVCKPGYLRLNANSTCLPTSKCPSNSKIPDESDECNLK